MTSFLGLLRRVRRDRRGNVLMMFGFAIIPLTFATGMGIDYARAMKSQTKLNAVADAAALVAVSKPVMALSDSTAAAYAAQMFYVQAGGLIGNSQVQITNVTASAPTDSTTGRRVATVTYTASSPNVFATLLGITALPIHGVSQTTNATAPNIDFYMLIDVSASMALPTTSAGLAKVAASNSKGCEFACHASNDLMGTDASGKTVDLYNVAKSYGLKLRIDDAGTAVSKLANDAQSTSSKNGASYKMGIYSFRGVGAFSTIQSLTSDLSTAATKTTNLVPFYFYSNNCPTKACPNTDPGWNDQDTASNDAFDHMASIMPTPGTGLNGNQSQAIMFIITDGMHDEARTHNYSLPEIAIDTQRCATLKSKGIRIAVLYTQYLPDSLTDTYSQQWVAPHLQNVEPALQACASSGLYTKVTTDQDIYGALDSLFQNAVATARISG